MYQRLPATVSFNARVINKFNHITRSIQPRPILNRHSICMASSSAEKGANRLSKEESPYLLQHQYNPVDWHPWGDEAFIKAKTENKPIFLSVGYSTCHWCHVMEHESFEDAKTAEILNEYFVPVKVDREERPDVDKIYMAYVQATTGGGGWPMSAFLTPNLEPFFGGTYFPPEDSYGRPGFKTVLKKIAAVWFEKQDDIKKQSAEVMKQLETLSLAEPPSADALTTTQQLEAIAACANSLAKRFDTKEGGFGGAPKFPRPSEIDVIFRQYAVLVARGMNEEARRLLHMALFTLQKMSAGGMYDHLGGGFARYSVDEYWHVPHFEKMLYDQSQLINSLVSAFQITKDTRYTFTARGILDYLLRDMRHPEGGFYAAEDADSMDEKAGKKKEGSFYVWTADEVIEALVEERAKIFNAHYYVKAQGNCDLSPRSDPHNEFVGKNVLIERQTLEETAKLTGTSVGQTEELLAQCRKTLFNLRQTRPRPHRDDKVVTSWNGLLIGALATSGRILSSEDPPVESLFPVEGCDPNEYITAAIKAADFVYEKLRDKDTDGGLRRAFTRNPSPVVGFSDDYCCMISGLLDLYSVTGEVRHLKWALELQEYLDEHFWDENSGGYYQAIQGDPSIKIRMKEDYDGAESASSSIATSNLWRFAGLLGTSQSKPFINRAKKCAVAFEERLREVPIAMPAMCCALYQLAVGHPRQVIIAGKTGAADTEALLDAAFSSFAPDKVIIHVDLSDEESLRWLREHNPDAVAMAEATGMTVDDPATAFICQNYTCQAPTTSAEKVKEVLSQARVLGAGKVSKVTVPLTKKE